MPKITKRFVDALAPRSAEYFVWDSEIPGFGPRVLPSGREGYVVRYRAGRRFQRISLGPSTVLTCEQPRNRAISIVAAARNGEEARVVRQIFSSYLAFGSVRALEQQMSTASIRSKLRALEKTLDSLDAADLS